MFANLQLLYGVPFFRLQQVNPYIPVPSSEKSLSQLFECTFFCAALEHSL